MKRLGFLLLLLGAAGTAHALALSADVRTTTLGNGLTLMLVPDSTAAAVDVAVWYDAGTLHERPGITGISHLFEHMMFRGSAHHGPEEHNRLVQAEGGTANAYTSPDLVCYYQTVPREALPLTLALEADRMASLQLTAANLEAERRVVLEERRWRAESGAAGQALQRLYGLAYPAHPYRWPVIGLEQDVQRITLAECQDFFRGHYAPNNALVTIVGNFDPAAALREARRTLGAVPRRAVPRAQVPKPPAQTAERRDVSRGDVQVPLLVVGWRAPGDPDPDTPALQLLTRIAAIGPSSRLQRALAGDGGARFVQGALDGRREAALLYVVTALRSPADSAKVEGALLGEMEKLAREPVSDAELEQARRQEETSQLFAWQTARGRAQALGTARLVDGDHRAASERLARLGQLTPADLQKAAARVLRAANRNVVWVLPAGTAMGGSR